MVDIFHYPFPLYRLFFCPANRVWGQAIERYIKDEAMVHDPEELETGVLFPVCRAEE